MIGNFANALELEPARRASAGAGARVPMTSIGTATAPPRCLGLLFHVLRSWNDAGQLSVRPRGIADCRRCRRANRSDSRTADCVRAAFEEVLEREAAQAIR